MFGKYKHTLDPKGRLFVPAKLREELGSAFYVARSLDPCLTVYTEEEWQRIVERSKAAPSSKARGLRTFFANVVRCEPDKQGRFLLHAGRAQLRGFHIGRGVKRFAEAVKFARQIPADVVGVNQLIVTLGSADAADKAAVALRKHANATPPDG